ncbi:MAG: M20/M25/M40 family metallo-hydrolase [Candidatus Lokiarchaeota archaeon]|nr:M20/M25/M40 family metallo-hydrolase [Candidatus Lokiarchaeota archaeon]
MDFDGQKARDFIEKINFPRRTGSKGNVKAFNIIEEDLEKLGYEVKYNEFEYVHSYLREVLAVKIGINLFFFLMVVLSISAGLLLTNPIERFVFLILSIICATVMLALTYFNFNLRYDKYLSEKFSQRLPKKEQYELPSAKNIIIEKKPKNKDIKNKHIILGAHYDTISISYHYLLNSIVYIISAVGTLFLGIYFIILDIFLFIVYPVGPILNIFIINGITLASIVSVAVVMWLATRLHNKSYGAVDNASGVSILMELARILKDTELNYRLSLIFFGVEEEGLLGSIHYVKSNLEDLKEEEVMMISLDTLGTDDQLTYAEGHGYPKNEYSKELIDKIRNAADELGIDIKPQWFPYPSSDHAAFVFQGFKATQLFSRTMIANTKQDTIDKIEVEQLEKIGNLVHKFLMNEN